jgi:predicted transcriptional regulator
MPADRFEPPAAALTDGRRLDIRRVCQNIDTTIGIPSFASPSMRKQSPPALSKRERQIMDVVYRLGRATAADVVAGLPDPPTYTTVRGLLRILEEKGHLRHEQDGPRYVYAPSTPREDAGASILWHVVRTFFDGSASKAMAALLGSGAASDAELARLTELVERAKSEDSGAIGVANGGQP